MRLFIAVEPTKPVREHLDAHVAHLRDSLAGWRWVPPHQWHLTLAFLGDVEPERVPELTRRMGLAARRHRPFDLEPAGLGAFRNTRRAHVLWAGVGGARPALVALADTVSAGARRAKIDVADRRYRPHLTLARRRTAVDLRDTLGQGYRGPSWPVTGFVLVESHVGAEVRHEIRERFPLG